MRNDASHRSLGPNSHLIGVAGSRGLLNTPCLVLDIRSMRRNIERAAAYCVENSVALRPHAKTHKCARIAHLQIGAGAKGICVATIGEAEALAAEGIADILLTSAITQDNKIERAAALAQTTNIALVADNPQVVRRIGLKASDLGVEIPVLVDVDLGRHRNGVASVEQAVDVASAIATSSSLRLAGMQAYASHISHVESFSERKAASLDCARTVQEIKEAASASGYRLDVVTGGSTGTLHIDPALGCYTELQCGSYVFSDVEYGAIELTETGHSPFESALFVVVSVIGGNWPGRVTCDGGNKHFSAKGTLPAFVREPVPGAVYRPDSDEHGIVELPVGADPPPLGASFELVVPHCDPTVNLYDHYHVVEGDTLIDIWPIEARGAF